MQDPPSGLHHCGKILTGIIVNIFQKIFLLALRQSDMTPRYKKDDSIGKPTAIETGFPIWSDKRSLLFLFLFSFSSCF